MTEPAIVSVLVPVAVEAPYTYRAPADVVVAPGDIVAVPLGTREVLGVVWDDPPDPEIGHNRLRAIIQRFETPPIGRDVRAFVDWVANYTLAQRGMVLRMVLRSAAALEPETPLPGVRLAGPPPERMTDARRRVLELLQEPWSAGGATGKEQEPWSAGGATGKEQEPWSAGGATGKEQEPWSAEGATGNATNQHLAWSKSGLAHAAGVSTSVVQGLVDSGTLAPVLIPPRPAALPPDPDHARPVLTGEQGRAADALKARVDAGGFSVTLLDGITGSGKTEVYFEAVAEAVRAGGQVLILVPEIALTADFLERFVGRFGVRPAEWHSDMAPKQRERVWRGALDGQVQVVVGARSALFIPFRQLRLIVIDEEHDVAYKQEDRVFYNARDMGVVRGHLSGFPVVLSSATPSIESRANADAGRYTRIVLSDRYAGARLPSIHAIDLRRDPPERGRFLSPPLVAGITETLEAKQQALLFLNRRGYAPLTLCRTCGHRFQCPNCSTWLVEHRFRGELMCHHCGHTEKRPDSCPNCGSDDSLVAVGPGVERLAEEVAERFPQARTIVLSSDIAGGIRRIRLELQSIAKGEADIVIGTQLVAKGHNFPLLSLVGVVDGDLGLAFGDLRAAERTFQLLSQVTGRAGRAGGESRALVQTYAADHPVIQAIVSGDSEAFYAREIEGRRNAGLPPFGRLAGIVVSGPERGPVQSYATHLRRAAPAEGAISVLGPAEAPLALIRGRHRWRLLVQAPRQADLQAYLRGWLKAVPQPRGGIRVQVDVDPQSFL